MIVEWAELACLEQDLDEILKQVIQEVNFVSKRHTFYFFDILYLDRLQFLARNSCQFCRCDSDLKKNLCLLQLQPLYLTEEKVLHHCGDMRDEEARFQHDVIKDHKKAAMKTRPVSIHTSV